LFSGPRGTGKHLAAEAIAYELGRPLHEISCGEIASSKLGAPKMLETLFHEAKGSNAVLVLTDAEAIFAPVFYGGGGSASAGGGSGSLSATLYTAQLTMKMLLSHMTHYGGLIIILHSTNELTTNKDGNPVKLKTEKMQEKLIRLLDSSLLSALRFTVFFPMLSVELREELWKRIIPKGTPIADDVDFAKLSQSYAFSGGSMMSALMRACEASILEGGSPLSMKMLDDACQTEKNNISLVCLPHLLLCISDPLILSC